MKKLRSLGARWMLILLLFPASWSSALEQAESPQSEQLRKHTDAALRLVGCSFDGDGGDRDAQCNSDSAMFVCETLRKQKRVTGCAIEPKSSKVPDIDTLKDADFLQNAKMDQAAQKYPCIVWDYDAAYVAPSRTRIQHICSVAVLTSLQCHSDPKSDSSGMGGVACPAQARLVCEVLHTAGIIARCR